MKVAENDSLEEGLLIINLSLCYCSFHHDFLVKNEEDCVLHPGRCPEKSQWTSRRTFLKSCSRKKISQLHFYCMKNKEAKIERTVGNIKYTARGQEMTQYTG